ncbi:hypothetical protein GCM10028805_62680 [Spirosoma harenae]
MRINFDDLFTVIEQVMIPKVRINIMSVIRGGSEMRLAKDSLMINGGDPLSWQGKDLLMDLRQIGNVQEYYIRGLAVA